MMNETPNILLIDFIASPQADLLGKLTRLGLSLVTAKPESQVHEIAALSPDLAVLSPALDTETCLKCVYKLRIADNSIPILILHRSTKPPESYNLFLPGVNCVGPDLSSEEISRAVSKLLSEKNAGLQDYPAIVGQSEGIREVRQKIHSVAPRDITVLITGETGTGKELVARFLHYHSPRRKGPLVKISCGALPDELLESEFFGFQKGAFTGAYRDKPGRLELAQGGTLFIDEVGDLSLPLQVKFLQSLEDKVFARLGGIRDEDVDVRVVAATNAELAKKVRQGKFRKDLFYRLNVIHIKVPPLREREGDIEWLSHYFLNKYCFEQKRDLFDIPTKVTKLFLSYRWPGNVRELENMVRRAVVLRDWSFVFKELQLENRAEAETNGSLKNEGPGAGWEKQKIKEAFKEKDFSLRKITKIYVSEAEKRSILNALEKTRWNRKLAAQLLEVSYKTLLNRIEELGIKPIQ